MPHPFDEFANLGFGQWAALGVKIGGRSVVDQALRDEIKFVRKGNEIIVAEKGAAKVLCPRYIVPLLNVPVNYDRTFVEAVKAGAPDTSPDDETLNIGDFYAPKHVGVVRRNITLVNFPTDVPTGIHLESVLQIGKERKWGRVIDPWECLAVSAYRPNLTCELSIGGQMTVVSLEQFIFQGARSRFQGQRFVTGVVWSGAERVVGLYEPERPLNSYFWFGFVR
jgi:hypothetical protein